jgi:glycosyltransferase involved in cell wall biosynthesis
MPNVLLEAMAAGLPVVAREVEGVAELLGPNTNLQMAPFGDATVYCQAVLELASNSQAMLELGSANQQRVEQHFSVAKMVAAYSDLIRHASSSGEKKSG